MYTDPHYVLPLLLNRTTDVHRGLVGSGHAHLPRPGVFRTGRLTDVVLAAGRRLRGRDGSQFGSGPTPAAPAPTARPALRGCR